MPPDFDATIAAALATVRRIKVAASTYPCVHARASEARGQALIREKNQCPDNDPATLNCHHQISPSLAPRSRLRTVGPLASKLLTGRAAPSLFVATPAYGGQVTIQYMRSILALWTAVSPAGQLECDG